MSAPLKDAAAREAIATDLDTTFVVEAAAGTGKTTVLVQRIAAIIRTGRARLTQVVAVTFTEKAAGEMKLRLRERLEREREAAAAGGVEHERLAQALEELEIARIGTIHGLCADLLREYPVEAGVDPRFEVADEEEADRLLELAFGRWFEAALRDPPEGVRRVLRRRPRGGDDPPRVQLFDAAQRLREHRDFAAPWTRPPFAREALLDDAVDALTALADAARRLQHRPERSAFVERLDDTRRLIDDLRHRESVGRGRDYDGLEAALHALSRPFGWNVGPYGRPTFQGLTTDAVVALRDEAAVKLRAFVQASEADLAACLQTELRPVLGAYEAEKRRRGLLDFVDILLVLRDALVRREDVRAALQGRFTHLFVDEFQDTDPRQTELLLLLAADTARQAQAFAATPVAGKLFLVGDPKQSIYRFRRADIVLYERVKAHLLAHGGRLLHLSTSFRATPAIQAAINAAFSHAHQERKEGRAEYVPLEPFRDRHEGQPSLVVLPIPKPGDGSRRKAEKGEVEKQVPDLVAAFVDFLVRRSGWTVEEDGKRVALEARHVCVLFKRFRGWGGTDLAQPYAQALEARRLPHVLVGGRSFHAREEVLALRTALRAIEWPDDELSVFACLKGPLFAVSDEALLVFRATLGGRLHPLRPFPPPWNVSPEHEALLQPIVAALAVLGELHHRRQYRGVAATLHALLAQTRAHAGIAFWKGGAQALANVLQLTERARKLERRATSFRDVVERLDAEAEAGEAPEAPIVEEGTEGVRMMTVHAAKGLEFPVVILAEPTANLSRKVPSHWAEPERELWAAPLAGCAPAELTANAAQALALDLEEGHRLTYVAATRAKDLLVVPQLSELRIDDTWLTVLEPALLPHDPAAAKPAPGCPAFGSDCVVDRAGGAPYGAIVPGLHLAQTKSHRVVWWDPHTLTLGAEPLGGLETEDALKPGPAADASAQAWTAWLQRRADTQRRGTVVVDRVVPARSVGLAPAAPYPEAETTRAGAGRPTEARFGALVHELLAVTDLRAGHQALLDRATVLGRTLGATEDERAAAADVVHAALGTPWLRRAAAAQELRREAALTLPLPDGRLVEGTLDFAFREGDTWFVLEFKTDAPDEERRAAYQAQLDVYVKAVAAATGAPTQGVLLWL